MKTRKLIIVATITACFALCAAVWPKVKTVEETPALNETNAVTAPKATVEGLKTEVEMAETEKIKMPQLELAEQAAEPPATQTTVEPLSGDIVYVPGFGWIESQGSNHVEYAADMYENGNKIGIMG